MCLSTVWDNRPSSRMVLLKKFDACGFVWYTNYNSRKAKQLEKNPHAALTFWWPETERSVRVEGMVCRTSEEESDEYFESRPLESRLGAMASEQSAVVESRHVVEMRWEGLKRRFVGGEGEFIEDVVRPKWWGGYRLRPTYMEFWKGRHARLHDRIVYECDDGDAMGDGTDVKWRRKRLQP